MGLIQIRNGGLLGDEQETSFGEKLEIFFDIQKTRQKVPYRIGGILQKNFLKMYILKIT